ncbi:WS/DGAT/MGAT family O-acyltransferase [Tsukamurella soli]|uniref:Diacylglycerol O-acyltransferase n=1 Tax=Tsukamurella soli TaxID=644556 RepID=A0ABP8KD37_9ACTN
MSYMPVTDSMFLIAESREHPMHVGGLQLFTPPEGAGPDFAREVVEILRSRHEVSDRFGRRPADPVGIMGNTWWTPVTELDLEYHVRHSALPQPGRIRELFQQVSLWHGTLLDRHRPMWEIQVVEGLGDGRIAIYSKVHHSLVDGVSALRYMTLTMSEDPQDREGRAVWQKGLGRRRRAAAGPKADRSGGRLPFDPVGTVRQIGGLTGEVLGMLPASLKVVGNVLRDHDYMAPFQAPDTIFNVPIGGARRFVAQSYSLDRIDAVRSKADATVNDVVLAMCGGALRAYLLELGALPDKTLTAMVPVSLRKEGDLDSSNSVGAIIATLGTDLADPVDRLEAIHNSVRAARRVMGELSPLQILAMSAANIAGLALSPVPGFVSHTKPPFNLVISNVPGPRAPMFWNGARLDGIYPASIALDGQAMNITISTNYRNLEFGIVACRQSVPHVQRLIHHLEDALTDLEKAFT